MYTFIQFDSDEIYPSFTKKKVLIHSINYAKNYIEITNEKLPIILTCKKTALMINDSTGIKPGLDNIDIPMGGLYSAPIPDIVWFGFFV